jgi:hypothetical protein
MALTQKSKDLALFAVAENHPAIGHSYRNSRYLPALPRWPHYSAVNLFIWPWTQFARLREQPGIAYLGSGLNRPA